MKRIATVVLVSGGLTIPLLVSGCAAPLIDGRILSSVLVMALVTAILGPVLTQRFAPQMLGPDPDRTAIENLPA